MPALWTRLISSGFSWIFLTPVTKPVSGKMRMSSALARILNPFFFASESSGGASMAASIWPCVSLINRPSTAPTATNFRSLSGSRPKCLAITRAPKMDDAFSISPRLAAAYLVGILAFLTLVQLLDKTAVVQLLDKPHIDKVLRLRSFRFWVRLRERFENFFDPLQAWILFLGKFVFGASVIIGPFQDLLVLQCEVFRQYFDPGFPISLDAVDGFNLRSDIPPDDVRIVPNERAGRSHADTLIR